jgi:hypothetical protein
VVEAFIHERSIDKTIYEHQLAHVNEEIALTQLEIHEAKLEELDIEAALNFAVKALSNAAQFWEANPCRRRERAHSAFGTELDRRGAMAEPLKPLQRVSFDM